MPLFWEQQSGLPGQQKIQITRSAEATKPAFDRHFDALSKAYGDVFAVNLLSEDKPSESELTRPVRVSNQSQLTQRAVRKAW